MAVYNYKQVLNNVKTKRFRFYKYILTSITIHYWHCRFIGFYYRTYCVFNYRITETLMNRITTAFTAHRATFGANALQNLLIL